MPLYRDQRGSFEESMITTQQFTKISELILHLIEIHGDGKIEVKDYHVHDYRCGWDVFIVTYNGNAVGYTNGPFYLSDYS